MRRLVTRRAALALGMLATMALAGCGSNSLSASQLRARATRICNAGRQQMNRIPTPTLPTQGAKFLTSGIAILRPELNALERLRPPAHLEREYRRVHALEASELRLLRSAVKGLKAGNDPVVVVKSLQRRLSPLEAQTSAGWRGLAIPACIDG